MYRHTISQRKYEIYGIWNILLRKQMIEYWKEPSAEKETLKHQCTHFCLIGGQVCVVQSRGLSVPCPPQGTAVFWYNLFPSGEGDYSTRHAACPVLVGNKWGEYLPLTWVWALLGGWLGFIFPLDFRNYVLCKGIYFWYFIYLISFYMLNIFYIIAYFIMYIKEINIILYSVYKLYCKSFCSFPAML